MYKGVTLDGDKVAIKVQYIDLQDRFISDLKAIVYLLKAITIVHPKFDLHWVLDVNMYFLSANTIMFTCVTFLFLLSIKFYEIFLLPKKFFFIFIFIGGY